MNPKTRPLRSGLLALALLCGVDARAGPVRGQVQEPTSAVRGRAILHETGEPLEGVLVTLTGGPGPVKGGRTRVTGPSGVFLYPELLPGLYVVSAESVGFATLQDSITVEPETELDITIPLSASPIPLEPIVVVLERQPLWHMRAFEARRRTARGVFFTREEIEESGAYEFTDLLRKVPGARVIPTGGYGNRVEFRGGCRPDVWVDGVLAGTTADLDSFLRPEEMEGVEVYKGAELPMEFGSNLCGAIVVWTASGGRTATDDGEGGSFLKRLALGAAFLVVAFLATH